VSVRRWHRLLGLILFLPLLGWAASGSFFFLKPGYTAAYAPLEVRRLGQAAPLALDSHGEWLEVRALRTVLGDHLLVRTADGWRHLRAGNLAPWPRPKPDTLRPLIADAIATDAGRYGSVERVDGETFVTSTGARITLDWDTLSLNQRGRDTDRIDAIYRVHYLQWTGVKAIDRVLGVAGIAGVLALATLGLRLLIQKQQV
jgi:hypothetical protein